MKNSIIILTRLIQKSNERLQDEIKVHFFCKIVLTPHQISVEEKESLKVANVRLLLGFTAKSNLGKNRS